MTSASSPVHSPKVRVCTDAKSLDGRHRVRRRGVSPTGSETFRYLFSDPMFLGLRLLGAYMVMETYYLHRVHHLNF